MEKGEHSIQGKQTKTLHRNQRKPLPQCQTSQAKPAMYLRQLRRLNSHCNLRVPRAVLATETVLVASAIMWVVAVVMVPKVMETTTTTTVAVVVGVENSLQKPI
jgi:hypothetical protein